MSKMTEENDVNKSKEDSKNSLMKENKVLSHLPPPYTFSLITSPFVKSMFRTPGIKLGDLFSV